MLCSKQELAQANASQNKQQRIGREENISQVCPSDRYNFRTSAE